MLNKSELIKLHEGKNIKYFKGKVTKDFQERFRSSERSLAFSENQKVYILLENDNIVWVVSYHHRNSRHRFTLDKAKQYLRCTKTSTADELTDKFHEAFGGEYEEFLEKRLIEHKKLKAGDKLAVTQLRPNMQIRLAGTDEAETFLGFTDIASKHGANPYEVYPSLKAVKAAYKVKTLKDLESLGIDKGHGYGVYIQTKNAIGENNTDYYIYKGCFCHGASRDKCKFYYEGVI